MVAGAVAWDRWGFHVADHRLESEESIGPISRDFTVATFVVDHDRLLLLFHRKLQMWLPPGGHIEPNELPDSAALREVEEETGIVARLLPAPALAAPGPRPLARPEGIQLEEITPDHQHIDLIYFAVPVGDMTVRENPREGSGGGWYPLDALAAMDVSAEVQQWARLAVQRVPERLAAECKMHCCPST